MSGVSDRTSNPSTCPHGGRTALTCIECLHTELERLTRERDEHKHDSEHTKGILRSAERDYKARIVRLQAALEELRDEVEAIMHGEHGADWADHFAPLFNLIQGAKALSGEPAPKRAYYETHDPPHCPTCGCGAQASDELAHLRRIGRAARALIDAFDPDDIADHISAPGFQAEWAALCDALLDGRPAHETTGKSRSAYISDLTVRRLDSGYVVTWQEDGEPCGSETISEKLAYALVRADGGILGITDDSAVKAGEKP